MENLPRLRAKFSQYAPIPEEEWLHFIKTVREVRVPRGQNFVSIGDKEGRIGFVVKGLFSVGYLDREGEKFIRNFCAEDSFVSAYTGALRDEPAEVEIQALENSQILYFSYRDYQKSMDRHHCWESIARKITESYFSLREYREYQFLTKSALERYELFQKDFRPLLGRISQTEAAAYVGVTPVSLSRLLGQKKRGKKYEME